MESIKPRVSMYKVKSGDSLHRIAQDQYGNPMFWPEVAKANRLARPNTIFVGQPLHLPVIQLAQRTAGPAEHAMRASAASSQLARPSRLIPMTRSAIPNSVSGTNSSPTIPLPTFLPGGNLQAAGICFPALKYEFEFEVPELPSGCTGLTLEPQLKGEITLQKKVTGICMELNLSNKSLLVTYEGEARDRLRKLIQVTGYSFNPLTKSFEVSTGFQGANPAVAPLRTQAKMTSGGLAITQEFAVAKLKGEFGGFCFEGTLKYQVTLRNKADQCNQSPETSALPAPAPQDSKKREWGTPVIGVIPVSPGTTAEVLLPATAVAGAITFIEAVEALGLVLLPIGL